MARQLAAGSVQFDDMRPLLEFISGQVPYGWLLLSQIYEEVCGEKGLPDAKEAVKRYLEAVPRGVDQVRGWERLTLLCERTHDFEGFVDAEASLCEVPGVPLNTMSNAATTVLAMLSKPLCRSQPFESRKNVKQMVPRIAAMIASHVDRCSGTDLSRLAWLSLVTENEPIAREWTERGSQMEPDNVHCLALAQRLGIQIGRSSPRTASRRTRT